MEKTGTCHLETRLVRSGTSVAQTGDMVFSRGRRGNLSPHSPRLPRCHRNIHSWRAWLQRHGTHDSLIAQLDVLAVVSWSQSSEEGAAWSTHFLWTPWHGDCDLLIVLTSFGQMARTLVCFVPDLAYHWDQVALGMVETCTRVTWVKESQC